MNNSSSFSICFLWVCSFIWLVDAAYMSWITTVAMEPETVVVWLLNWPLTRKPSMLLCWTLRWTFSHWTNGPEPHCCFKLWSPWSGTLSYHEERKYTTFSCVFDSLVWSGSFRSEVYSDFGMLFMLTFTFISDWGYP